MKHQDLISKMTLEEKASLCSGKDFWHLKGLEKFNIPEIMVCDGPHGPVSYTHLDVYKRQSLR